MKELILDGRVHVFDGAMGTLLYNRGVFVNVCYDELNVGRPDIVREIHEEYVAAGAEVLETNTFGANPVKLSSYGLAERTEEINEAAGHLAKQAAGSFAKVGGAIGPLGIRIEPWGPLLAKKPSISSSGRSLGLSLAEWMGSSSRHSPTSRRSGVRSPPCESCRIYRSWHK
jgi:S-methylmethionine-dependent homocysteine/selenocysteine methylase